MESRPDERNESLESEGTGGRAPETPDRAGWLDVAARRIAALSRQWADDLPPAGALTRDEVADELRALVQELQTVHDQLRRQTAELEQARAVITAERARFRELFEIAREGYVLTDPAGTIRECNRAAAAMLNIPAEYLVGKPLAVFVDPVDRRDFRVRIYRARAETADQEWATTVLPRDLPRLGVSVAVEPVTDGHGRTTGLRWLLRDIPATRGERVMAREQAAIVRAALDALSAHVAVLDAGGRIVTVNRAWSDARVPAGLFGLGAVAGADYLAMCGAALDAGRTGADAVRDAVLAVLHGTIDRAEVVYAGGAMNDGDGAGDANRCWYALRVTRCDGAEPAAAVVTHEDITAERQSYARERALLNERAGRTAAEAASRAKSEFLTMLSHELRTPLNAIAGYAQLLEMGVRGPVTPAQSEDLRRILRSERHLLGLINELLNLARVERGDVRIELSPVSLTAAVREVLELVEPQAASRSLTLAAECPESGVMANSDPEKLRQILINLLSNALKFTRSGGTVRVTCGVGGDGAFIRVDDTGVGIDDSKLQEIFDPFVQVHRGLANPGEGIGLGLAISRNLARAMGGDLQAHSRVGIGSSFELTLARATESEAVT